MVQTILRDAAAAELTRMERIRFAAPLSGTVIDDDRVNAASAACEAISRLRLARALSETGRTQDALRHFESFLAAMPESARGYFGLGDAYLKQDQLSPAVAAFRAALRYDGQHAETHFRLALALEKQGGHAEAIGHYRQGLALMPTTIEPANNLAWLLATSRDATLRNGAEAVRWAEQCAQATAFRDPSILDSLAAAYAEQGRFDQAIRWQTQAVRLAPARRQSQYRSRLALYQSKQPYRLP